MSLGQSKGCNLGFLYNKYSVGHTIEDDTNFNAFVSSLAAVSISVSGTKEEKNLLMYCSQGEPVIIFAVGGNSTTATRDYSINITDIEITYGNN